MRRMLAVALTVMAAAGGLAACGDDPPRVASSERLRPARPDGLGLTRTELRVGGDETQLRVTWQRALDASARRDRDPAVFVMFFDRGAERPSAMVMTDLAGRAIRCGRDQLEDSAPWVFAHAGPFADCPDLLSLRVEAADTSISISWPKGAVRLPKDIEWVVRVASLLPGGPPLEEFLPDQPQPVTGWPTQRAAMDD